MIGVTIFGLIFTPFFYVVTRGLGERYAAWRGKRPDATPAALAPIPAE